MEQVFEICKCAEDDKVKFAMRTFEGRALTWWNGNVQTLGLADAKSVPLTTLQAMMSHILPINFLKSKVLMCPELVSTESKKTEKYICGFPERIKENITSSKPATLREAINMARELPQLEERFMLKIYQNATGATYTIMDRVLKVPEMTTNTAQQLYCEYLLITIHSSVCYPDYCLNIIAKLPYCREVPIYHEPLIAIVVSASIMDSVTPSNLSTQRNVEYPRALLYGSIAQDLRTTTKRVV
ncbi:hypothetical protein Tco_0237917 [Tanacetum coccineum]